MGSFIVRVIKWSRFKDGNVRYLQKCRYFFGFLDFHQHEKYDLTNNRRFLQP